MLSAPKLSATEVVAEENKVQEEEAEGLLIQRIKPIMNIQITHTTLTTLKIRGEEARYGPISPILNVTTVRSMATMNENAERSQQTRIVAELMSLKKKAHQK